MKVSEYIADGAWDVLRRVLERAFRLMIDTGGLSIGIRFGTDSLTFTTSPSSAAKTVTHNLGKTPQAILALPTLGTEYTVINYVSASRGTTTFQVQGQTASGGNLNTTVGFFWLVCG